jgi:hypothetical protein
MTRRKFKIGELVELVQRAGMNAPRGPYEIVRLLPEEHGVPLYRIKLWHEETERVAEEIQLRPFG